MKLIGMMMARDEDWVIGLSLRAALLWCDEMIVLLHRCRDRTYEIVNGLVGSPEGCQRISVILRDEDPWPEMACRQEMLDAARYRGATHAAIIDADEVLTGNLLGEIRPWIEALPPGKLLELPLLAAWRGLETYRDDSSVWSRSFLTLAFPMSPDLYYKSRNGYEFHNRPPGGTDLVNRVRRFTDKRCGGVFHLQFANWNRLAWKHTHYKMMEALRWPGRETPEAVDRKYEKALDEHGIATRSAHCAWWDPYREWLPLVNLSGAAWHEAECRRLLKEHGRERFAGLRLRGLEEEVAISNVQCSTPKSEPGRDVPP